MIRDNIQGKSFKKNYGYLLNCDIDEFFFLALVHSNPAIFHSYFDRKELIQIIQNRIKILS